MKARSEDEKYLANRRLAAEITRKRRLGRDLESKVRKMVLSDEDFNLNSQTGHMLIRSYIKKLGGLYEI